MQEVYNKTMAMLFRGTKNLANNNAEVEMEETGEESQSKDKVRNFLKIFFLIQNICPGQLQAAVAKGSWTPHLLIIKIYVLS